MTNAQQHLVALSRNIICTVHAQKSGINGIVCVIDAKGKTVTTTGTYPAAQRKAAVMNGAQS